MKKIFLLSFVLLASFFSLLSLTACSSDDEDETMDPALVGDWKLVAHLYEHGDKKDTTLVNSDVSLRLFANGFYEIFYGSSPGGMVKCFTKDGSLFVKIETGYKGKDYHLSDDGKTLVIDHRCRADYRDLYLLYETPFYSDVFKKK